MKSIDFDGEVRKPGSIDVDTGLVSGALESAGPSEAATHATVVGSDGYRASIPLPMLHAGGMLNVDDRTVDLRVVDGTTLCWNVKSVARIEVSIGKQADDVPEKPTH
jgi:hypothetical protein